MPIQKLREFPDHNGVKYVAISYSPEYTAQEIAASGRELAKTVMVKLDGKLAMVVLPATRQINFSRLQESPGAGEADLASEAEFAAVFPGCEVGAMPPFGNLYGLESMWTKACPKMNRSSSTRVPTRS